MTTQPHIDTHFNLEAMKHLAELCCIGLPHAETIYTPERELTICVQPKDILSTLAFLKDGDGLHFTQCMDVCGVDYLGYTPAHPKRFAVVYHLLSLEKNLRVRVKTYVNENEPVPSVVSLFPAANWFERETYDMFGIVFSNHPDLRRILTDYDFIGHPLRKDFPLNGYTEVYFDTKQNRVAYKPVDLPQPLRHFDKVSGWLGATGNAHLADSDNVFVREEFK